MHNNDIQPSASIGDLVHVDGYGDHIYVVDSYSIQRHYEKGASYSEVIYDLSCPWLTDYIIADDDEITVVCKSESASEYLAKIEPPSTTAAPTLFGYDLSAITQKDVKPTPKRKPTKQAEIDALLDEHITIQTVMANGFAEDEHFRGRLAEVEQKLKEVSGG